MWCHFLKLVIYRNTNQDMTCLFFSQPPCFKVRGEEHDEILLITACLSLTQIVIVLLKCKRMPVDSWAFKACQHLCPNALIEQK